MAICPVGRRLHLPPFLLLAALSIPQAAESQGTCVAQTGEEAMQALRTKLNCPNPETVPRGCPCAGHKEPKVACPYDEKELWAANWTGAASDCVKVTPDAKDDWSKHDFHYPSNYANTCDQAGKEPGSYHCTFVKGKEAMHEFAHGPNYNSAWNSEAWCTDKFCWVDPCTCNALDISPSSWLNGHYSYSACGAVDQYTPPMCDDKMDMSGCVATSGCKWLEEQPAPEPEPEPPAPPPMEPGMCMAQSGEEAMMTLRMKLNCPNPEKIPSMCPCSGNTEPKVACPADEKALWEANWTGAASDCIKVTPDAMEDWSKHEFHYPSNYANTCDQAGKEPGSYHCTFVKGKEAMHEFAHGPNYNSAWDSQPWCTDKFCWVDPCNCNALDISPSSWLKGHYSYSACGAVDQYTPPMCDDKLVSSECVATSGCKWVLPPTEEESEGSMPMPSMPYGKPMPHGHHGRRPTYHEWAKAWAAKWSKKHGKTWTAAKTKELRKRAPQAPRAPRAPYSAKPPRHPRPPAPPHKWYGEGMMPRRLKEQASESVLV